MPRYARPTSLFSLCFSYSHDVQLHTLSVTVSVYCTVLAGRASSSEFDKGQAKLNTKLIKENVDTTKNEVVVTESQGLNIGSFHNHLKWGCLYLKFVRPSRG